MRNLKVRDRWSDGVDHEPESKALVELIADMDYLHFNDYFCFKLGGDGDNGEILMYIIDALIENGLIEIKIGRQSLADRYISQIINDPKPWNAAQQNERDGFEIPCSDRYDGEDDDL